MTKAIAIFVVTCAVVALNCTAGEPVVFPDVGESLVLDAGDVSLNASLLLPQGKGPFPAVVGLVGSGAYTYRDAWIEGHWAFWKELSSVLVEQRIAVLLLDKRGVAGSDGSWKTRTLQDRAADALVAVRHLRRREDIDGDRVGVMGQSQGGWVAQIAAASAPRDIAFVITFAGPATTVLEQVVDDHESGLRCENRAAAAIAKKRKKYEARLRRFGGFGHLRMIQEYDPAADLRAIRQPFLAIFAEHDELVWPEKNIALLKTAFADSGNTWLWTHTIPGANHAFLYGEPCQPLKGHDGPPAFKAALLNPEFFSAVGIPLDRQAPNHGERLDVPTNDSSKTRPTGGGFGATSFSVRPREQRLPATTAPEPIR